MTNEKLLQFDFGPLESILADSSITEIMVDSYDQIIVEKGGKLVETDAKFRDKDHLMQFVVDLAQATGRVVNESNPIVDLRFSDGSRANIVIPPIAADGPTLVLRKMTPYWLTRDDVIRFGSATPEMMDFLEACVEARLNIMVAGGVGSGKTTILNVLIDAIPEGERVISVDPMAELHIDRKFHVRLEGRPPNIEGKGEIDATDLVVNSLKMRPDRIVLSEARGGEVLHYLQAMNTGIDGSLFSIHANSVRDAIARFEVMGTMGMPDLPLMSLREQMATGIDLIVHQSRLRDGSRKMLTITEVVGFQNGLITMQDIFEFEQTGYEDGKIIGHSRPTGIVPKFLPVLNESGTTKFSEDFFAVKE